MYSRRRRRKYDDDWGWQLCREWEAKIDFLEQVVLFDKEPIVKTWEPALKLRITNRIEREAKLKLDKELRSLAKHERKLKAASLNICWRCYQPIAFMMVDCLNCGDIQ
jgi:Rps23 Pro-64 3,4-dihydroxylase Tpa1-like proline 4-hydroxylase